MMNSTDCLTERSQTRTFGNSSECRSLVDLFNCAVLKHSGTGTLSFPDGDSWRSWSYAGLGEMVKRLAFGLADIGIQKGEPVGILAPSSPFWLLVDMAIQSAGAVTVPLSRKLPRERMARQVTESGMKYLFVGNPGETPESFPEIPEAVKIIRFWHCGRHPEFDQLVLRGKMLERREPALLTRIRESVRESDVATFIFTSGTTGESKAVELTHANLLSQLRGCAVLFPADSKQDVCLSALPLDHVFERMVVYYYIAAGLPVYFIDDPKKLGVYARSVRPTIMTAVPRILEKVADRFRETAADARGIRGMIARAAISRATAKDIEVPFRGPVDALFKKLVYSRMTGAIGGRLRLVMSGSARLPSETARLLINIGIPVYEGYGMTEASPVIAASHFGRRKLGTTGPLFPGVEAKIALDGEILVRGPNVMKGYRGDPRATRAAFTTDGWLRTGDVGGLDSEGYLTVEHRKRELLKKSTGEFVVPVPIERALSRATFVDTAVVVAEGRAFVTALLFPDMQKVSAFKTRSGHGFMSDTDFLSSSFLQATTQDLVNEINTHLPDSERVERFTILGNAALVETGELTPTLKPRRHFITEKYISVIDTMYGPGGGGI